QSSRPLSPAPRTLLHPPPCDSPCHRPIQRCQSPRPWRLLSTSTLPLEYQSTSRWRNLLAQSHELRQNGLSRQGVYVCSVRTFTSMRLQNLKLVTIVAEEILKERLCKKGLELGASGYTSFTVGGDGSRGIRDDMVQGMNVQIEFVCTEIVA